MPEQEIFAAIPVHTFEAAKHCLVCGRADVPLRSEAIVPEAILGRVFVPQSICTDCQAVTQATEAAVVDNFLGVMACRPVTPEALAVGAQCMALLTSTGKERGEATQVDLVRLMRRPEAITLVATPAPHFLRYGEGGTPPEVEPNCKITVSFKEPNTLAHDYAAMPNAALDGLDMNAWFRMIAKIAHFYALANVSPEVLSQYDLLLAQGIREGFENPRYYMGSDLRQESSGDYVKNPASDYLYALECFERENEQDRIRVLMCRVRLFACLEGTPNYTAVIGRRAI